MNAGDGANMSGPVVRARSRLLGMDFVRVVALLGVVLYHSAAAYSTNTPYWSVHDGSSAIATGIRELVDVFIMPLFFFLAGYFAISSLRRRGYWSFFKSKFWELWYVWLIIVLIALPVLWYYVNTRSSGVSTGFLHSWLDWVQGIGQTTIGVATTASQMVHMHFWFVSLLFYFFVIFILVHMATTRLFRPLSAEPKLKSSPKRSMWLTLGIFAIATTVFYYVSLLLVPDTSWLNVKLFLQVQPSKLFLYAAYFGFGVYCSSQNWFVDGRSIGSLKVWVPATIVLGAAFLIIGQDVFLNPATTTSLSPAFLFAFAVVRSFLLVAVLMTLTTLGMLYFNRPNRIIHTMADNSYYIYLIHAVVVSMFQDILEVWPGGSPVAKLLIVFLVSIPFSYALSRWVFRKLTLRQWVYRMFRGMPKSLPTQVES